MNRGKLLVLTAALLLSALLAATSANSLSNGITRPTLPNEGCVCHAEDQKSGKPSPDVQVYFHIDGNPVAFEPNKEYNLTFGAAKTPVAASEAGNKGGFNLKVSVGTLSAPAGWQDLVRIEPTGTEATHTKKGDQEKGRNWSLTWKAPGEDTQPAVFTLWINTVDGSGSNDGGDKFSGGTFVVLNKLGAQLGAGGGVDPEKIGVNWLAHWVGITSVLAVVGTLLIYYFVLKFGESIHTTDHRDRKEK